MLGWDTTKKSYYILVSSTLFLGHTKLQYREKANTLRNHATNGVLLLNIYLFPYAVALNRPFYRQT